MPIFKEQNAIVKIHTQRCGVEKAPHRGNKALPPKKEGGTTSCAAVMCLNRLTATVPSKVLFFPDSGHTCISFPYPSLPRLHSSSLAKNYCHSISAFVDAGNDVKPALSSGLLTDSSMWLSQTWEELSRSDEHAPAAHFVGTTSQLECPHIA